MMRFEGFHGRGGLGSRPALLVVDMSLGFTDPGSPLVCDLDDVVAAIERLLRISRAAGFPVIYTTVAYDEGGKQAAAAFVEIDPRIAPQADEPVLTKLFASAFFGTTLASLLVGAGCDSVIVTGASTSGCVRATVVDALQHGYRPLVPREAVGDRNPEAHEASLYDIDAKYGDVVSLDEAVDHLEELAATHAR
jgi:nicotinamidase-related amidase